MTWSRVNSVLVESVYHGSQATVTMGMMAKPIRENFLEKMTCGQQLEGRERMEEGTWTRRSKTFTLVTETTLCPSARA